MNVAEPSRIVLITTRNAISQATFRRSRNLVHG
jgi:hypothetical protein